jgi:hypothetical protein
MRLGLTERKATSMGRLVVGRQHCDRVMEERGRRQCAEMKLRRRHTRADMSERVECRGVRLRVAAGEAVLRRVAAVVLRRAHIREGRLVLVPAVVVAVRVTVRRLVRSRRLRIASKGKVPSLRERALFYVTNIAT